MIGVVHAEGWDLAQIWITAAFAAFACVANGWLTFTAPRRMRPVCAAISALAGFYVAAYLVLIFGPIAPIDWTRGIRYPGWLVWPLVWVFVPWKMIGFAREVAAKGVARRVDLGDKIVEKVAELLEVPLDD